MKKGYFGDFGGQFVPELLVPPLLELEEACERILHDQAFEAEYAALLRSEERRVGKECRSRWSPYH